MQKEKGHAATPISYAQYRYKKWLTEPTKIKIKLLGGDQFQCDLMGDASNAKTYMKWYYTYSRVVVKKKFNKASSLFRGPQEGSRRSEKAFQGSQEGITRAESRAQA